LNGLEISGETPYRYQLAMAVPRGQQILAGIVDKVLADLRAEEIERLQAPWGGGLRDRRPAWREMATYGLPIVLLILVSVAILLAMN
ncbi:hypothetical protein KQ783_15365, partial [Listeria monocytogenes]|nr:hypothetical protein [Listeria monocytogenes]